MIFYLAQHGRSAEEAVDPKRGLTAQGIAETETVGAEAERKNLSIGRIIHSGKLRAHQTAQLLAEYVNALEIDEMKGMNPSDSVVEFAARMEYDDVLYVGHLPFMQKLISYLIAGREDLKIVDVVNSALICMERTDSIVSIKWIIVPDVTQG